MARRLRLGVGCQYAAAAAGTRDPGLPPRATLPASRCLARRVPGRRRPGRRASREAQSESTENGMMPLCSVGLVRPGPGRPPPPASHGPEYVAAVQSSPPPAAAAVSESHARVTSPAIRMPVPPGCGRACLGVYELSDTDAAAGNIK